MSRNSRPREINPSFAAHVPLPLREAAVMDILNQSGRPLTVMQIGMALGLTHPESVSSSISRLRRKGKIRAVDPYAKPARFVIDEEDLY